MLNIKRDLSFGSFGKDVRELQLALNDLGYTKLTGTGFFGTKTQDNVIKFQLDNNVTPAYGYVGVKTLFALNMKLTKNNRENFWASAQSYLGTDVTPNDLVPDEVGCAEAVNEVHYKTFGQYIGGGASTYNLYACLNASKDFIRVDTPLYGDIVISPTGYGNGKLSNGHVGIVSKDNKIMSNNSFNGYFEENYTVDSWRKRYVDVGGYPMVYFRKI